MGARIYRELLIWAVAINR